jgi:hypothetical protein
MSKEHANGEVYSDKSECGLPWVKCKSLHRLNQQKIVDIGILARPGAIY